MILEGAFTLPVASVQAWNLLLDPGALRRCIPGCASLERVDATHYRGQVVNEVAHIRFNASFNAELVLVEPYQRVQAVLKGEDRRLSSSLRVDVTLVVEEMTQSEATEEGITPAQGRSSRIQYYMDVALWGKIGRLGEPIFRRRMTEVESQFVHAVIGECSSGLGYETTRATSAPIQHSERADGSIDRADRK